VNVELAEDVSHVGLDRRKAEEESVGDLSVGLAVDDGPCDLEFALRQRLDANSIGFTRSRPLVDAMAETSEFALGRGAISERAAGVKLCGGALELDYRSLGPAGVRER